MSQYPSGYDASGQPDQKPKGWFGRNWLWFVPVVILLPLLCCCGGPAAFFWWASGHIFEMAPYKDSVAAAQQSPEVQQALGTPITAPESFIELVQVGQSGGKFNTNTSGSTIDLDIELPISGPNGSGMLVIVADSADGGATWTYTTQEVRIDSTGEVIDLKTGKTMQGVGDAVNEAVDTVRDSLNQDDETSP